MIGIKFDMHVNDIMNMQSDDYVFQICCHINLISGSYSQLL